MELLELMEGVVPWREFVSQLTAVAPPKATGRPPFAHEASALLHGEESMAFGDAGYQGVEKCLEATDIKWQVAMRPGKPRVLDKNSPWGNLLDQAEQLKASVRAKVKHPFRILKCQFGFTKVRNKGLAKNTAQLITRFALSNSWMVRKRIIQGAIG